MNKLGISDVILCICVVVTLGSLIATNSISKSSEIKLEQIRNDHKLKQYELVTKRTEAEAMLIYAKALEVSCSSALVNKWGEVYSR